MKKSEKREGLSKAKGKKNNFTCEQPKRKRRSGCRYRIRDSQKSLPNLSVSQRR